MDFLLNEKSVHGQFNSIDDFLESLRPIIKCIEIIHTYSDMQILKIQNFYECQVTKDMIISDLKSHSSTDELMRFQASLDNEIYDLPHWDTNPVHDILQEFKWEGEDVSATALAEAAVTSNPLLSFDSEKFRDCILLIESIGQSFSVDSVHTPKYLVEQYRASLNISRRDILMVRYAGTRIDCSTLEGKYGASGLEKHEFELLLSTFDKFVKHDSWESIERDDGLEYKKYKPSSVKYDWFHSARYKGKTIMKFRFSDVLRCYGYRKNDKFKVLRFERDHSISDNG